MNSMNTLLLPGRSGIPKQSGSIPKAQTLLTYTSYLPLRSMAQNNKILF